MADFRSSSFPLESFEPFWNPIKPLRGLVDNADGKVLPRLTCYLLVKLIDEIHGVGRKLPRRPRS